jgi:AraC-like DNA-binding protein
VLILSALSDVVIPVLAAAGLRDGVIWLVTGFSTASLVALGLLGLAPDLEGVAEPEAAQPATEGDAALVAALEQMLEARRLALDPDLTLARIARRMGVPAKALSAAVNRVRGENISRVVNRWRIAHAAGMLQDGASVTEAMLGSGFNTKSNFNREFLRVMGQAPTAWMAGARVKG